MTTGDEDGADETARIARDLENLERRYGALEDSVRYLKLGFDAFVVDFVALALWGVFIGNAGLIVVALALLACLRGARWIDVVGWAPPGLLGVSVKRSEAMAIEDMIAERRRRLALLQPKPSEPTQPPQSPSGPAD
jgi:hypothetical protein